MLKATEIREINDFFDYFIDVRKMNIYGCLQLFEGGARAGRFFDRRAQVFIIIF